MKHSIDYYIEHIEPENSAKEFVDRMIKLGHGVMLEHGTIYLNIPEQTYTETLEDEFGKFNNPNNGIVDRYSKNKYSKVNSVAANEELRKKYPKVRPFKLTHHYITTNLRVIVENGWEEDLKWQCDPTEHHEKRITAKFICDRGVSHVFELRCSGAAHPDAKKLADELKSLMNVKNIELNSVK